ncbi:gliding motility-associated C-terminal domain-containing protein [Euzebyella marina]|uniref:Gliding motility-associated C-terminal domain-containing protein n=2 Tax=Euzebyella marina TaxID=1761453 RepID=A0A3G2L9C0_9FLAO|nr:gliding motility-associated C-terminal domain-containing protein [Euzebyella marina]
MNRFQLGLLFLLIGFQMAKAQVSPDCANAIPICNDTPVNGGTNGLGNDDFNAAETSGCLERALEGTIESNSAWYRFRTGASGQLGFNIGIDTGEDWDFALYRTNDCGALGEPIRCNFFDNQDGNAFIGVGEDPTGDDLNVQYETWLEVEPGEDYYLFINNFSNNNSGFSIQFSGQIFVTNPYDALDCSIIDNLLGPPIASCQGTIVNLDATTSNATAYNWFVDNGSGYNALVGENGTNLAVSVSGMYRVEVVRPTGNLYSDVQVAFSPTPTTNPVADDAFCEGTDFYDLSVKDMEALGVQDPNDFLVNYHETPADAANGINALPKQLEVTQGIQTIFVRVSSLDNPRCFDASQSFQIINLETPEIDFETEAYICENANGITIGENNPDPNYAYRWSTGETTPAIVVNEAGDFTLNIYNNQAGFSCENSATIRVYVSRPPVINDVLVHDLRNNNTVTVLTEDNRSLQFQIDDSPFQEANTFYEVLPGRHTINVNDPNGCGMVSEDIIVVGFPRFFTPNSDGSNDYWHIEGIETLESPVVHIFDRFGKLLTQLNENSAGWDGLLNGKPMPETDYWFKLTYTNLEGNVVEAKYINSHFSLKR